MKPGIKTGHVFPRTQERLDALKDIIAGETWDAPISDRQLVELLQQQGFRHISRTYASKLRERLGIPSYLERSDELYKQHIEAKNAQTGQTTVNPTT